MKQIDMNSTNHVFIKSNLVTILGKKGTYDVFKCEKCGISGKSYTIGYLQVDGRLKYSKVHNCPGAERSKKIKITHCYAVGRQFANLKDGSVHEVIEPPEGYDNSRGVWVMGVGEPVKVLFGEFVEEI